MTKMFLLCTAMIPIAVHYELPEVGAMLVIASILFLNVVNNKIKKS
jgi:hypothetical protein